MIESHVVHGVQVFDGTGQEEIVVLPSSDVGVATVRDAMVHVLNSKRFRDGTFPIAVVQALFTGLAHAPADKVMETAKELSTLDMKESGIYSPKEYQQWKLEQITKAAAAARKGALGESWFTSKSCTIACGVILIGSWVFEHRELMTQPGTLVLGVWLLALTIWSRSR